MQVAAAVITSAFKHAMLDIDHQEVNGGDFSCLKLVALVYLQLTKASPSLSLAVSTTNLIRSKCTLNLPVILLNV